MVLSDLSQYQGPHHCPCGASDTHHAWLSPLRSKGKWDESMVKLPARAGQEHAYSSLFKEGASAFPANAFRWAEYFIDQKNSVETSEKFSRHTWVHALCKPTISNKRDVMFTFYNQTLRVRCVAQQENTCLLSPRCWSQFPGPKH